MADTGFLVKKIIYRNRIIVTVGLWIRRSFRRYLFTDKKTQLKTFTGDRDYHTMLREAMKTRNHCKNHDRFVFLLTQADVILTRTMSCRTTIVIILYYNITFVSSIAVYERLVFILQIVLNMSHFVVSRYKIDKIHRCALFDSEVLGIVKVPSRCVTH